MKHSLSLSTAAMALFLLSLSSVRLTAQDKTTTYQVMSLGTPGGTSSIANTINNRDWAIGCANLADNAGFHATVWTNGFKIDLGTLGGTNRVVAWPVKNNRESSPEYRNSRHKTHWAKASPARHFSRKTAPTRPRSWLSRYPVTRTL
jgi:hypothetical protein